MSEEIQRRVDERWKEFRERTLCGANLGAEFEVVMHNTFSYGFMSGWEECIKLSTDELIGKE